MRIGFILDRSVSNINYRAVGPAEALHKAGHEVELQFVGPDLGIDIERLRRCDVVHVYRLTNKETMRYMDDLASHGIALTWDNDDDIRLLPPGARAHARIPVLQAEREFRNQPKIFRRADVVTTTSGSLAERFGLLGAREVIRVPNYPRPDQYASWQRHDGIVIGWVAALEHYVDAAPLRITEALGNVLDRHPTVRVVTVGVRLELASDRYVHHSSVQLIDLKDHLRTWDVGIAPIADLPMNHARSDVKLKEYAAAGVPWLASGRGPYTGYGEREGGMLVEDDAWESTLEAFVRSRLKRARLRRRAAAWGKSQSIDRHVAEWVAVFEHAIDAASQRPGDSGATAAERG